MALDPRPELSDVIAQYVRGAVHGIPVMRPARVRAWSASSPDRATVQPVIRRTRRSTDGTLIHFLPPPIYGCPVAWPGAGAFSATWPLAPGDTGMILFSDDAIDEWLESDGGDVTSNHMRNHAYADAVFVPGLRAFETIPANAAHADGHVISIPSAKFLFLGSSVATEWVALADKVLTRLNEIESKFNNHTHPYLTPAMPSGATPTSITTTPVAPVTTLDNLRSTKVKSE